MTKYMLFFMGAQMDSAPTDAQRAEMKKQWEGWMGGLQSKGALEGGEPLTLEERLSQNAHLTIR